MVTSIEGPSLTQPHSPLIIWSRNVTWQNKIVVFSVKTRPTSIKLGTMVTKCEWLPSRGKRVNDSHRVVT